MKRPYRRLGAFPLPPRYALLEHKGWAIYCDARGRVVHQAIDSRQARLAVWELYVWGRVL
jgi:hypothetical protein